MPGLQKGYVFYETWYFFAGCLFGGWWLDFTFWKGNSYVDVMKLSENTIADQAAKPNIEVWQKNAMFRNVPMFLLEKNILN